MTLGWAALLLMVGLVGFLSYRGSGSIAKAITGAIAIPLLALVVIAAVAPREWIEAIGAAGFVVLLIATVAYLIWSNRPSA